MNLSRRQVALADLPDRLREIIADTGMPPGCLHLEVTESAVMKDAATAVRTLQSIRELGVKLLMDDFGTGYSSLTCLRQFPMDGLKIDQSFVAALGTRRDHAALVQAIIQLAHNLNLTVVAEGIENSRQLSMLQMLNCDFGQGYFFSKPLTVDQVELFTAATIRMLIQQASVPLASA